MLRSLLLLALVFLCVPRAHALTLIENKTARARVSVDVGEVTVEQRKAVDETVHWLIDALERASGARLPVGDVKGHAVVLFTTQNARPELGKRLKLREHFDAYAIETTPEQLTLIGANVYALRHAVAHVLRDLGFRYYAPSPRWHIVPALPHVHVDVNGSEAPDIATRSIWYAYGQPDKTLNENYQRWVLGNRLSLRPLTQTGHSYGNIIQRNQAEFAKHPEYYAMNADGQREKKVPQASKFCFSNPDLQELVARDRIRLLEENRKANPLAYMVSVDPSDGQGTCHCEDCKALGTTTDRVFHLANHVARKLREKHPDAWVGLYAYSSHRLPPTIAVEPNVYVQVALGFNQTEFTLPELVERWSKKVSTLGLREYYGVEAWDWGLPGRIRGGKVAYHQEWIPFYAARKANAFNGETNANWAGQMLGLDVAAELMWNVKTDVPAYADRYFKDCFGTAVPVLRAFQKKLEAGGPLQAATIRPMFADLEKAATMTDDIRIQARLTDLMAYLVYVDAYRRFERVAGSQSSRNEAYYKALESLMNYTWRIRERDMVHYYALARRLCNGLPLQDKRLDFYMNRKDQPPVWMTGAQLTDEEIRMRFQAAFKAIKEDADISLAFSRNFQLVRPKGPDAGSSRLLALPKEMGIAEFRRKVTGYFVAGGQQDVVLEVKPAKRPVTLTVFARGDEVLAKETASDPARFSPVKISLPRANEYRFVLEGDAFVKTSTQVPLLYEASPTHPASVEYSGPHYFYVPRGTRQIYLDTRVRLSFHIPGQAKRIDVTPADRKPGQSHIAIDVPAGADGQLWHTDRNTRGQFLFLNIPPLLSLHRTPAFVPREIAEADGLTISP